MRAADFLARTSRARIIAKSLPPRPRTGANAWRSCSPSTPSPAAELIRKPSPPSGTVACRLPTDSCYALGCLIGQGGHGRIRRIRNADKNTIHAGLPRPVRDRKYARVDNSQYRTLRAFTPGPYTFLLEATRECPSGCKPKRRHDRHPVPDSPIVSMLLAELGEPIMSSTLCCRRVGAMTDPMR